MFSDFPGYIRKTKMGVRLEMSQLLMVMLERKIQNQKITLIFMALGSDLLRHLAGSVTWSMWGQTFLIIVM